MKNKTFSLLGFLMLLPLWVAAQGIHITSMRINELESPLGIDPDRSPAFSWILASDKAGTVQRAYRMVVNAGGKKVWDSGKVETDRSAGIPYGGKLMPDTEYTWTLQVWDNHGKASKKVSSQWQTGIQGWPAETWRQCSLQQSRQRVGDTQQQRNVPTYRGKPVL